MRKAMAVVLVGLVILAGSCTKSSSAGPAGSWTFKANTYSGLTCVGNTANATLTAANTVVGGTYGNVVVTFPGTLPVDTGTYLVAYAGYAPTAKHVTISLAYETSDTLIYYGSTGGNGKNQKVFANIKNGKLEISGTGIEMINDTGGNPDSSSLSLDIIQTQ